MKQIIAFLRAAIAHPKTTAMGMAGLAGAATAVLHDRSQITNPVMWTGALVSIGLLLGADGQPPAGTPA